MLLIISTLYEQEHEVAQGEALLNGASKEQASNIAQQVKQT